MAAAREHGRKQLAEAQREAEEQARPTLTMALLTTAILTMAEEQARPKLLWLSSLRLYSLRLYQLWLYPLWLLYSTEQARLLEQRHAYVT